MLQLSENTLKSYMFVWLLTEVSSEYCSSKSEGAEGKEGTRSIHAAAGRQRRVKPRMY